MYELLYGYYYYFQLLVWVHFVLLVIFTPDETLSSFHVDFHDVPAAHGVPGFLLVLESAGLRYPRRGVAARGHSVQQPPTGPEGQSDSSYTAGPDDSLKIS